MTAIVEVREGLFGKRVFQVEYVSSECDETHLRYSSRNGSNIACFALEDIIVRYDPDFVKEISK